MKVKVKVKKFPVQVHLVYINIKYMAKLCKEIFKVQFVPAAAAGPTAEVAVAVAAHTPVNLRARQLCWGCSITQYILFMYANY